MPRSKTTKKREAKVKTHSKESAQRLLVKADDMSDVADVTHVVTDVIPDKTSDVTDAVITETKTAQGDDRKEKGSESHFLLNSEDGGKDSSVLMTPEKTPLKKPLAPHIITTPPVETRKLGTDGKREQTTLLESIQEKDGVISYEVLDSPAAKQPRGKQRKVQGGMAGHSQRRGCRHVVTRSTRVTHGSNDGVPSKCNSANDISTQEVQLTPEMEINQELKTELSSCGGTNKKMHDTKISDYYPIRRSSRRTETELKKEIDRNFQDCIESKRQDGLEVKEFVGKGRGIVAARTFTRNEFVVEYIGDLIDVGTAKTKESEYLAKKSGCYMYYFNHKNKNYCVDATAESEHFGRLVNHSRVKPNCHTKVVEVKGEPHLILLASRKIEVGEELLYDYGDRSKDALVAHPWLAL